ncbi:SDR family NAD(P)-dependent oxidoreductase [Gordonia terrae]|uniref:SDR family NAD(P)-dependent oxidoreductase n=1 Tax=Gordonia hongkongensis TaxID=1701090 RepID=UPI0022B391E9|nr:SDR family NAD(P)-dependent oxidoreductase [Gordonia terrae]
MKRFTDRVALITGAGSGIGAATAYRLASEGASVVVTDIDSTGKQVVSELVGAGREATWVQLDVASGDDWDAATDVVRRHFGRLDVLVNNAGLGDLRTIEDSSLDDYSRIISIMQTGVFLGVKATGDLLKESKGNVVNVSSMFGVVGALGLSPAYHAAKGAVASMTRGLAVNWGSAGIRVNAILPGFVDTPLIGGADITPMTAATPLQRAGTAEEVAAAIAFLASDDAAFVIGAALAVDGGYTAR